MQTRRDPTGGLKLPGRSMRARGDAKQAIPATLNGAGAHPKRRRANRPAGSVGSIRAGSSIRSCPSCAAVARGACCRRAFRRGRRCIGISRRGATAACGCRSTIVRRWRCACSGDGRPAHRPALSTAGLRRRCRAAVRGASTPARRSRAASAISSPLPAGCPWGRRSIPPTSGTATARPPCRFRYAIGFHGCAVFSPMAPGRVRNSRRPSRARAGCGSRRSGAHAAAGGSKRCRGVGRWSGRRHG